MFGSVAQHQEDARVAPGFDERPVGVEDERVSGTEDHGAELFEFDAVSTHGADFGSVVALEVELGQRAVDARESGPQHGLDGRIGIFAGGFSCAVVAGEPLVGAEVEIEHSDEGDARADLPEFEHRESVESGVEHHAVYDQIGRRSDERAHAPEDGGVGERDEEFAGCQAAPSGPLPDDGDENDDDGRIVQEGRDGGDRGQDAQISFADGHSVSYGEEPPDQMSEGVASPHALADEEEQPDGDHAFVGESGEDLLRGEDPRAHEEHDAGEEDESRAEPVGDQHSHHQAEPGEDDPDFEVSIHSFQQNYQNPGGGQNAANPFPGVRKRAPNRKIRNRDRPFPHLFRSLRPPVSAARSRSATARSALLSAISFRILSDWIPVICLRPAVASSSLLRPLSRLFRPDLLSLSRTAPRRASLPSSALPDTRFQGRTGDNLLNNIGRLLDTKTEAAPGPGASV